MWCCLCGRPQIGVSWGRHTLRAEELARDVERLAADNNDLLTAKELLGHNGGKAAKEMALAIDDDLWREEGQRNVHCQFQR